MNKTKIIMLAAAIAMPTVAAAETPVKFFALYGIDMYQNIEAKWKDGNDIISKGNAQIFNDAGSLAIGMDIKGVQISVMPQFAKISDEQTTAIWLNAAIPLVYDVNAFGGFVPYISLMGGYITYSMDADGVYFTEKVEESTFGWAAGAGVRYWFNENVFITGEANWQNIKFSKLGDTDVSRETAGIAIRTSLGYKF